MPTYILVVTIKSQLFWLTLTTYVYKAILTLDRVWTLESDNSMRPLDITPSLIVVRMDEIIINLKYNDNIK